jgi:hypothetical protein
MDRAFITKLAWIVFLFGIALFFAGVDFSYLKILIAIAAAILGILHLA